MTLDELLETPFVLIGTVEQVRRHRERFGSTHWTAHAPHVEAFAPG